MAGNQRPTISGVGDLSETRLWKTLDSISERLSGIETQLSEVVRLEERVNQHDRTISRYGDRLDNHDNRLRESEIWQANYGDRSSVERLVTNAQTEITDLKKKIDELESNLDVSKGQKDVGKEVLKWLVGILGALLIWKLTKG